MCAIVGDSVISGLKENLISKSGSIKGRSFPGSTVEGVVPLMKKRPNYLIIQVGTNNAANHTSEFKLLNLKTLSANNINTANFLSRQQLEELI